LAGGHDARLFYRSGLREAAAGNAQQRERLAQAISASAG
jgi:hypothetical protein